MADKFLKAHEDVRDQYEAAIKELLVGDHPEKVDAIINGKIVVIKTVLAGTRGDVYT